MTALEAMEAEVRALESLDLESLRSAWRRLIGPPPKLRSVELLRALLAFRLQAKVLGGIDADLRQRLTPRARQQREQGLAPGHRLTREWRGVRHEVEVISDGYLYAGQRYGSLSVIARTITGVRWNGPRFFGLEKARAA